MPRTQRPFEQVESLTLLSGGALAFQRGAGAGATTFALANLTPEEGAMVRELLIRIKTAGTGASNDTYALQEVFGGATLASGVVTNASAVETVFRLRGPAMGGAGAKCSKAAMDLQIAITHGSAVTAGATVMAAVAFQM